MVVGAGKESFKMLEAEWDSYKQNEGSRECCLDGEERWLASTLLGAQYFEGAGETVS